MNVKLCSCYISVCPVNYTYCPTHCDEYGELQGSKCCQIPLTCCDMVCVFNVSITNLESSGDQLDLYSKLIHIHASHSQG